MAVFAPKNRTRDTSHVLRATCTARATSAALTDSLGLNTDSVQCRLDPLTDLIKRPKAMQDAVPLPTSFNVIQNAFGPTDQDFTHAQPATVQSDCPCYGVPGVPHPRFPHPVVSTQPTRRLPVAVSNLLLMPGDLPVPILPLFQDIPSHKVEGLSNPLDRKRCQHPDAQINTGYTPLSNYWRWHQDRPVEVPSVSGRVVQDFAASHLVRDVAFNASVRDDQSGLADVLGHRQLNRSTIDAVRPIALDGGVVAGPSPCFPIFPVLRETRLVFQLTSLPHLTKLKVRRPSLSQLLQGFLGDIGRQGFKSRMTSECTIEGFVGRDLITSQKELAAIIVSSIPKCRDAIAHDLQLLRLTWLRIKPYFISLHNCNYTFLNVSCKEMLCFKTKIDLLLKQLLSLPGLNARASRNFEVNS